MIDDMLHHLATVEERPLWQPIPDAVKDRFRQPLPEAGSGAASVYEEFGRDVLPYNMGTIHPRFWGWVIGSGVPDAMLAEFLAAVMNPNLGGGDHAANYVEHQVLGWMKSLFGFPPEASGLLVSGGSMANLVGLTVARNARAEVDLRREGLPAAPRRMVLYASNQTHSSNKKAVELLGLGSDALRLIPTDAEYRIDLATLEKAIAADKAAGLYPYCLIGHAGTVNTGAFDDLNALADIAGREGLWFHVDGAFGAFAAVTADYAGLAAGMERADSLAFDLHKWMYLPYEIGCTLVRNEETHRRTFAETPDYLAHGTRGLHAGTSWFSEYGIQLSRGFRALKAWFAIKSHGMGIFREAIQGNIEQARHLADRVEAEAELELLAPVPLNIVCFRFNDGSVPAEKLDALNEELLIRLHESGLAAPSYTRLNGQYAIRAAITNHRSTLADFDLLVDKVLELGRELAG